MTKFAIVRPNSQSIEEFEAQDIELAYLAAGFDAINNDHAIVERDLDGGIGIAVYEYGLFVPTEQQHYFAIHSRLFAGNAVLYGFDQVGETRDLTSADLIDFPLKFYLDASEVEAAMRLGVVCRPVMAVGDGTVWEWPEPMPLYMRRELEQRGNS